MTTIPLFTIVPAETQAVTKALNDLIVRLNANFIAGVPTGAVTLQQVKQQLAVVDTGSFALVADNISSAPYSALNIGWNGPYMRIGDTLYNFIATQLGYNTAQMLSFFAACAGMPLTP